MDHLINIDNGGTLTDICVWNGAGYSFTKTLTTPFDLSQCLFDGLGKASAQVYGHHDLDRLLHNTDHIRYSTTQGTNALVERKGPKIGLVVEDEGVVAEFRADQSSRALFHDLIDDRTAVVDPSMPDHDFAFELVQAVNRLTTDGAERIVVIGESPRSEQQMRRVLLRKLPRHLLGSVPLLYSWDLVADRSRDRRGWSSILNSFLHPVMEGFLYQAQHRLRDMKITNPLLVYRNDGASSRVAKAVALKTYSSGPRGGLEGTRALADSYGLARVLMMDVGGTTTDVGIVENGAISTSRRGAVEGVSISFPMSNVHSSGIGGSSVITVHGGEITVGPRSVGAAPGPACFGLGGKEATITDVNLLLGVLDPDTYLDGRLRLDTDRARAVITDTIATPLGVGLGEALIRMEQAYFAAIADSFAALADETTTLAAFGGAGPMSAAGAARLAGVSEVLIPRTAAVFSAFGIGFSDIGKTYEVLVDDAGTEQAAATFDQVLVRAERDMFQEGYDLADCTQTWQLIVEDETGEQFSMTPYTRGDRIDAAGKQVSLRLDVAAALRHPRLDPAADLPAVTAVPNGTRAVRTAADQVDDVPVFVLSEQPPGARAAGPAIVEGPFFTARVPHGWRFDVTSHGDLLLTDIN
jgi:N-methylhydantoinase A/oxoprolinase/acetone carboxylase beta subunit